MESRLSSFQSANVMPWKIFRDVALIKSICAHGRIPPRHLQIAPTSRCNLNCQFCSCKNRTKGVELSIKDLKKIVDISSRLKVAGFTVTGDGEPLLHPQINQFLYYASDKGIKIGLVSNGLKILNLESEAMKRLTWARISFSDDRKFDSEFIRQMNALRQVSTCDLAFSYVVTPNYQIDKIVWIVNYANENNFTHVRLVADIYRPDAVDIESISACLKRLDVDTSRCIFQGRSAWTTGKKECWISLLKPMIASDGHIYPCCGVQYALPHADRQRTFPAEMRMGHYRDLPSIFWEQRHFNGSVCLKCYYTSYNVALAHLKTKYQHQEFI